jgi:predicted amidohydrolase YtcJ
LCGLCGSNSDMATVSRRTLLKSTGFGAMLAAVPQGAAAAAMQGKPAVADMIIFNATVRTMDPLRPATQAVAVANGRILAAGSTREVMRFSGRDTQRINARGKTVIPGLNDSHFHQIRAAVEAPNVPLADARSVADVVQAIGDRVSETPAGEWVTAQSAWHEALLAEDRLPTRDDLDPVSPENPVWIPRGGHVGTSNSAALARAGITANTPDPEGGVIVRDATGRPTGVLLERARDLMQAVLPPPPSLTQQRRLMREQMARMNAMGITSVTDPRLSADDIELYLDMWQTGDLTVRSHLLAAFRTIQDVERTVSAFKPRSGDDMLRMDGLKYLCDGGVEGARLYEPYQTVEGEQTDPNYRGLMLLPPGGEEELLACYRTAAEHGFQVQTHAVGDETIDTVTQLYEEVATNHDLASLRWTIMHLFLPRPTALDTMRRLGVMGTVQDHPVLLGENQVRWWGKERGSYAVPVRDILNAGIATGGGSDAPVILPSPFLSLWWMTTRKMLDGHVLGADQAIRIDEALRLYTTGSAATQFADDRVGMLRAGMIADMVLLDEDPLTVEADAVRDITPTATWLGGNLVHER